MKTGYAIVLLLFCSLFTQGQGQANWWFFGSNAEISFSSGSPVSVAGGALSTQEGCASISDPSGTLLFYTDGIRVWNRNNLVMPNGTGLLGDPSSTQSGVIVQKPGSSTIYYIFTVDQQAAADGLRWSEVDMTLNSGLGDITANKNILLYTPSDEKICGVRHCNGTDIWVVTHNWNSNQFSTYLVTSAGVNNVPVLSNTGTIHQGNNTYTIGYLKASLDGTKLAGAVDWANYIELFDFDNSTGIVSHGIVLDSTDRHYGVEFSPNSTLVYSSCESAPTTIYQWNLCAGSDAAIKASKIAIVHPTGTGGALQLGPDNKIYHSRVGTSNLGVINNPDVIGVGCNYNPTGVTLATGSCNFGLPNFISSYVRQPPVISDSVSAINCLVAGFNFSITNGTPGVCTSSGNNVVSIAWDFGDPASGANNLSSLPNPTHAFSQSGTYQVTLVVNHTCYSDTSHHSVTVVSCGMGVSISGYTDVCEGSCTSMQATVTGGSAPYTYSWFPAGGTSAGPVSVCPANSTIYTVTVTDAIGTTATATAAINVNLLPVVNAGPDVSICNGGAVTLNATGALTYTWTPCTNLAPCNTASVTANPSSTFVYTVTGSDQHNCSNSDNVTVTVNNAPQLVAPSNPSLCAGDTITLSMSGALSYQWAPQSGIVSAGSSDSSSVRVTLTSGSSYTVTGTSATGCSASITFPVIVHQLPVPTITPDGPVSFCAGGSVLLTATSPGAVSFLWNTLEITQAVHVNSTGNYQVTVTDGNGCRGISAAQHVQVNPAPPASLTPSGSISICNSSGITLDANTGAGLGYEWYHDNVIINGATSSSYFASSVGDYQVRVTDLATGCTSWTQITHLILGNGPAVTIQSSGGSGCLQNTIYVGLGPQNITLTAVSPGAVSYLWSTGATTPSITVTSGGTYSVTAYDAGGCPSPADSGSHITIQTIDIRCGHNMDKIILCHVPEGNPGNPQTICVARPAIDDHLRLHRYDCLGPCSLYYNVRMARPEEIMQEFTLEIFPNPSNDEFEISMYGDDDLPVKLMLYDVTGRMLMQYDNPATGLKIGQDLVKGIYYLSVLHGTESQVLRLSKMK